MSDQSRPPISREALRYARWLDRITRAGFVVLLVTFFVYVLELLPAAVPLAEIAHHWALPLEQYLAATGGPVGWQWIERLEQGDSLTFIGVAMMGFATIWCYLAVLPIFLKRGDWLYGTIILLEIAVLALAAGGLGISH